jgi:CO/xanthine dehydrogenase Mo-binding subunit
LPERALDLFQRAAEWFGLPDPGSVCLDGNAIRVRGTEKRLPLEVLGDRFRAEFRYFPPDTVGLPEVGEKSRYGQVDFKSRRTHWAYSHGAQIVWLEVDPGTGEVKVLKVIAVADVGRVLNRRAIEAPDVGGLGMGLGYA